MEVLTLSRKLAWLETVFVEQSSVGPIVLSEILSTIGEEICHSTVHLFYDFNMRSSNTLR